jgi:hypothetical protein
MLELAYEKEGMLVHNTSEVFVEEDKLALKARR